MQTPANSSLYPSTLAAFSSLTKENSMTLADWSNFGSLSLYIFFALLLVAGLIAKHFDL